jgi:hypothetical protein
MVSLLCVAILCVATTVELSHTHARFFSLTHSSTHQASAPDNTCTICMAAHSPALIFALAKLAAPVRREIRVEVVRTQNLARTFDFSLFIRPPPLG